MSSNFQTKQDEINQSISKSFGDDQIKKKERFSRPLSSGGGTKSFKNDN